MPTLEILADGAIWRQRAEKAEAEVAALRALCASESEAMYRARDEHSCHSEECDACESVFDGAILRLRAAGRGEGEK